MTVITALYNTTTTPAGLAPYLCSIDFGAGSLSPHNDTLQLHHRGGGGDDDDDEGEDGDDGHDDDVLQHVKDLWVVQVQLSGHQVVHRGVGQRVNRCLHVNLQGSKQCSLVTVTNQHRREVISTRKTSHKHSNKDLSRLQ